MNGRRAFLAALVAVAAWPLAAPGQTPTVRVRGTIEALTPTRLTLRELGGARIELALAPNLVMTEVFPVTLDDIRAGSYVGVGAVPQPDGSQRAVAVTLFPESARGASEGHFPYNIIPQGTMTNATVAEVAVAPDGQRLQLTYKDGRQTIVVPPGTPIVSFRPGTRDLLVVGAVVALTAQELAGQPTAMRISAGRDGFRPPY